MTRPSTGRAAPDGVHGVVPPTITAFDGDGAVDHEATAAHARFLVDSGVHAAFPLGTNGGYPLLSGTERDAVVETVVSAVDGEVPVLAGVGTPGTRRTVERARAAEAAGADGCFVVTPYYYDLDRAGALAHYRTVASAVPVPIYAYQIPSLTGTMLERDTVSELASEGTIAGIKDSSRDMAWLGQVTAATPELAVLVGSDTILYQGLASGCAGVVSAVSNVFPELTLELYAAVAEGDHGRALDLQRRVYAVRRALAIGDAPHAGVRAALSLRGVEVGPPRGPLRAMSSADRDRLRERLEDLGLL